MAVLGPVIGPSSAYLRTAQAGRLVEGLRPGLDARRRVAAQRRAAVVDAGQLGGHGVARRAQQLGDLALHGERAAQQRDLVRRGTARAARPCRRSRSACSSRELLDPALGGQPALGPGQLEQRLGGIAHATAISAHAVAQVGRAAWRCWRICSTSRSRRASIVSRLQKT